MKILLFILFMLCGFVVYCCILIGDDRKYFDEYYGKIEINIHYNQKKEEVIADWSKYISHNLIIIDYYTRQEELETAQPQFFPHGVVRTLKDTKEVYDWYDLSEY
ncbi:hypothetical protein IJ425_07155 [bacterium]|nr:hypothetical protein [bacterium]